MKEHGKRAHELTSDKTSGAADGTRALVDGGGVSTRTFFVGGSDDSPNVSAATAETSSSSLEA